MSQKKTKTNQRAVPNAATTAHVVTTKFATGDDVAHPQFGDGTVTGIESNRLTIKFTDGRVKQILDDYVKQRPR